MTNFEQAYQNLNDAQREAVDHIEGPVMLVAGPGAGKTQVLSLRIANILRNHPDMAKNILALTFTDSAAKNMRERLYKLIGEAAYQVNITTFHGFCNEIIQGRPEIFLFSRELIQIDELTQYKFIAEILENPDYTELTHNHNPELYFGDILRSISSLKMEGISPEEYTDIVSREEEEFKENAEINPKTQKLKGKWSKLEKTINKNKEFAQIYAEYNKMLEAGGFYDYNDMINFVTRELQDNPDFLADIQESFQYILVDEYQDTNGSQNQLILKICSYEQPNVFVVGDEDQSIYSFQGANLKNMLEFQHRFPEAKVIATKYNYRSTQPILDLAKDVISRGNARIEGVDKDLVSKVSEGAGAIVDPKVIEFDTGDDEVTALVAEIKQILARGERAEDIAVIYRSHKDVAELAEALSGADITFQTETGGNVLLKPAITRFINSLRWLAGVGADSGAEKLDLLTLLSLPGLKIPALDVYRLSKIASKHDLVEVLADPEILAEHGIGEITSISQTFGNLTELYAQAQAAPAVEILGRLVIGLEALGEAKLLESAEDIAAVLRLVQFAKSRTKSSSEIYRLSDFINDIDEMIANKLTIKSPSRKDGVHLLTAHKSKGQEFKYVFIIKAVEGIWNNKRAPARFKLLEINPETEPQIEEDLRLFYVAITRCKQNLWITYSNRYQDGEHAKELNPSLFVTEISPGLVDHEQKSASGVSGEERASSNLDALSELKQFMPVSDKSQPQIEEYLTELVSNLRFSYSSLKNYFDCPQRFMYLNLLRLPTQTSENMIIGSALHLALEKYHLGQASSLAQLEAVIASYITRADIEPERKEILRTEAKEIITGYYIELEKGSAEVAHTEFSFREVHLGDIVLTGKVDLIEKNGDHTFNFVDYKSGKPKSRNQILGVSKSEFASDYYDQLTFYTLLAELDPRKRFAGVKGVLRFLKPRDSGKYAEEVFEIDREKREELKERIKQAVTDIRALKFWQRCETTDCIVCSRFGI